MRKDIHPKVRQVVFKDTSSDFCFRNGFFKRDHQMTRRQELSFVEY
jgi:ribosomal protein L31